MGGGWGGGGEEIRGDLRGMKPPLYIPTMVSFQSLLRWCEQDLVRPQQWFPNSFRNCSLLSAVAAFA